MSPAIALERVSKRFRSERRSSRGFKALLLDPRTWMRAAQATEVRALDALSLEVARGETLGLIGRNGAGKSTLLAIVAGILAPTTGTVRVEGRISPILGLGVGFCAELSGRENVVLGAILLGMRRAEAEASLAGIVEFAGLGAVIDRPFKTYSSGMQMRLGFAVAAHASPDVLLIDEALAVGDAEFHERCLERIRSLRAAGVTILVASHGLATLEAICDRAVLLDDGRLVEAGAPRTVIARYTDSLRTNTPRPAEGAAA